MLMLMLTRLLGGVTTPAQQAPLDPGPMLDGVTMRGVGPEGIIAWWAAAAQEGHDY